MGDVDRCICDLIEVTTLGQLARGEAQYMRGFSNGCEVHPATEYERQSVARQERYDMQRAAAQEAGQRRAREV